MNKILVLCPSRGRPQQCKAMVDSFLLNSSCSVLKLLLDNNDPYLDEYRDIIKDVSYTIEDQTTTTELINSHWQYTADCYKYFSVTNDDFIYKTKDWDLKLIKKINGIGIAYGNDLLAGQAIPTTSVVSREIVEALGWLQMPTLTHLFGDNVWNYIGRACGCIHYVPEVIIEHRHVFARKAEADETHNHTNSKEMYRVDEQAFIKWIKENSKEDIAKVKEVMNRKLVYR